MFDRSSSALRLAAATAMLSLSALAAAQPVFHLPANYLSRFSSTELLASSEAGFGVRYVPLPLTQDIRISVVKAPTYWDYGVSARLNDTSLAAGVFYNVPKLEVTHDPSRGLQFRGLVQGNGATSFFTGGYAFTALGDRVRVLNNVGVGFEGDSVAAPYTQTEVGGGYGRAFGKFNASFGATARVFTFPAQRQAQGSLDFSVSANISPLRGLTLDASHFERFAVGKVTLGALNYGRYEESNASLTYRLPVGSTPPAFTVGALRTRVNRVWTGNVTSVYADLLLRAEVIPSMFGPSVGYQWAADGTGKWLFSLAFMGK